MLQHICSLDRYVAVLLTSLSTGIWQVIIQSCLPAVGRNRRVCVHIWQIEQYVLKEMNGLPCHSLN